MLNQREMDVLSILCGSDKSLTATQIVGRRKGLTQSTVTAVLRKMLRENLVEVDGVTHSGKVLSRMYKPSATCLETITEHFKQMYSSVAYIVSLRDVCAYLLEMDTESDAEKKNEIAQMKKAVREYEKTL
ncbi:MAG: MarR family transcriptional regulator [Lachnospiraceae bacterium]|nr:MarR family transcriptional regulator [Lachnospiraceae bacterium]MBR1852494.1 MarR family transcriptional regulator [Lachnospiraceae bacterium]